LDRQDPRVACATEAAESALQRKLLGAPSLLHASRNDTSQPATDQLIRMYSPSIRFPQNRPFPEACECLGEQKRGRD
jgi:hypothetical protein